MIFHFKLCNVLNQYSVNNLVIFPQFLFQKEARLICIPVGWKPEHTCSILTQI